VADKLEPYTLVDAARPRMTRVEIKLKGGRVLEGEQEDARGSETLPFTQEVIEAKFLRLAGVLLPQDQARRIMQHVSRLESLSSLSDLVPLLQRNAGSK
jgi:2-methylcitrate dehydratase PrpD